MVVPCVDTNAKVTNFFSILPNTLFPTYLPQADSLLERSRRMDGQHSSPLVSLVLYFAERVEPYPQAQLYWAGQTMGWMAD
jgi:hypothetical protein